MHGNRTIQDLTVPCGAGAHVAPLQMLFRGMCDERGEQLLDDDRAWFLAHPDRDYRVRPPMAAELAQGVGEHKLVIIEASIRFLMPGSDRVEMFRRRIPFNPIVGESYETDAACAAVWRRAENAAFGVTP